MKGLIHPDFMLGSAAARELYHSYAAGLPIFDYHCHLSPSDLAADRRFENMTRIWLEGDHYKWRAMRANGIDEHLITGGASDVEKFRAWAATVPMLIGNPLYHWTHMELHRPFGIDDELLGPETADTVWERTLARLQDPDLSMQAILRDMKVRVVGTTDDPLDDLAAHAALADNPDFRVVPSFRPDKALYIGNREVFRAWLQRLEALVGRDLPTFEDFVAALAERIAFFHAHGCRISDHAMVAPVFVAASADVVQGVYQRVRDGGQADPEAAAAFQTALIVELGRMYAARNWTMQLHIGALRNNNTRMFEALGPDTGYDSIADQPVAAPLNALLNALDVTNQLPRTIVYALRGGIHDVLASAVGNFQDGKIAGKMQYGAAWWLQDHDRGIREQLLAVAESGVLSRFVGMLTDSRSILSYPRHDYFRRILCDLIGGWVENGAAPRDYALLGGMVQDICWNNAVRYFGIDLPAGVGEVRHQ